MATTAAAADNHHPHPHTCNKSTVFTLPCSPKRDDEERAMDWCSSSAAQQQQQLQQGVYEDFPTASSEGGPSLPWLVDYWSSSFLRTPALVLEHLCACSSNVHQQEGTTTPVSTSAAQRSSMVSLDDDDEAAAGVVATTNSNNHKQVLMVDRLDEAYRIDINDPNYFDNVILAARNAPSVPTPGASSKTNKSHKVPRPITKKKVQHRKTKSLLTRWDKLRAVVASHEESSVSSSGYGYFEDLSAASFDEADPRYPSKMQRLTSNYRQSSIVLDTEDEEEDDDIEEDDYEDDILLNPIVMMTEHTTTTSPAREDEMRMAPPRSRSNSRDDHDEATYHEYLLATQQQPGRHDYQEYMELVACSSFDPDLDTIKYVGIEPSSSAAAEDEATAALSTPPTSSRQLATPPARPIRSRPPAILVSTPRTTADHEDDVQLDAESLDEAAETREVADSDQITPLPHRSIVGSPVRVSRIRTPPSPAPSTYSTAGDTCTTISLSQSYVNSFDREEHEDDDETDQMFLDRLASEHLLTGIPSPPRPVVTDLLIDEEETASVSSSAFFFEESSSTRPHSSSLMTNKSKSNIKKTLIQKIGGGNPFRNLKPGSSSSNKNKKIQKTKFVPASYSAETKDEAEEEEGIEHTLGEANDENLYPTKPNTTLRASSYAGRLSGSSKLSRDDADDDDDECATHSTSSIPATTHLAYRYLIRMNPQHYKHRNGSQCSLTVPDLGSASRSVSKGTDDDKEAAAAPPEALLLPLHPHQRIMAPLPHHDSPFDEDHSGYTYFPDTVRRHQGIEELQQHPDHNHRQPAEPQPLFPLLD